MTRNRKAKIEVDTSPVALPEGFIANLQLGLDGRPIERTPRSNPYGFDAHYHYYRAYEGQRATIYSDRIAQQHYDKLTEARKKFPECWSMERFDLEQAEGALSHVFDRKVKIVGVIFHCNRSTGYPVWAFEIEDKPQ
ncbi:MAG: hypothetical protein KF904_21140 [Rhodoblastus sp.]|nr:hypothetical protein [Rhodoblastus sp.]